MKLILSTLSLLVLFLGSLHAQENQKIYKISKELLAGEGLDKIKQKDATRTVYQKKVFNGEDIAIFMVAIGTGITNEFESFPLEEFIFWMNGKAIITPKGQASFEVQTGDYFIQAKGFNGKWNFVDINGVHLELSVIARNRPDATFKSPIDKAMIIDRDIISGVKKPENGLIYKGPELTVNLLHTKKDLAKSSQERMLLSLIHI